MSHWCSVLWEDSLGLVQRCVHSDPGQHSAQLRLIQHPHFSCLFAHLKPCPSPFLCPQCMPLLSACLPFQIPWPWPSPHCGIFSDLLSSADGGHRLTLPTTPEGGQHLHGPAEHQASSPAHSHRGEPDCGLGAVALASPLPAPALLSCSLLSLPPDPGLGLEEHEELSDGQHLFPQPRGGVWWPNGAVLCHQKPSKEP